VVWAIVIAIALYPVYEKIVAMVGRRRKLAGALFIVLSLTLVIVPVWLMTDSLLDATVRIVEKAKAGTLEIPPPTEKVKGWPLIGEKTYNLWMAASNDLEGAAEKLQPQLRDFGEGVVRQVAGLGGALLMTIIALIFVPIVLIYQGWSYWVFRKRIGREDTLEY